MVNLSPLQFFVKWEELLVDIHGQHEHQELMDETKHLSLLISLEVNEITKSLSEYEQIYAKYEQAIKEIKKLK